MVTSSILFADTYHSCRVPVHSAILAPRTLAAMDILAPPSPTWEDCFLAPEPFEPIADNTQSPSPTLSQSSDCTPSTELLTSGGSVCVADFPGTLIPSDTRPVNDEVVPRKLRNGPRRTSPTGFIQEWRKRYLCFSKRKDGLLAKSRKLLNLTGCQLMLFVCDTQRTGQVHMVASDRLARVATNPHIQSFIRQCLIHPDPALANKPPPMQVPLLNQTSAPAL